MGKATDFKLGLYIHTLHPNKGHENWEEKTEWANQVAAQISYSYPLLGLSQKRVKLRISNLAGKFRGFTGT